MSYRQAVNFVRDAVHYTEQDKMVDWDWVREELKKAGWELDKVVEGL